MMWSSARMTTEEFLERLENVRPAGRAKWTARCPGHDDHRNSLSVAATTDRTLVHCHVGCTIEEITAGARCAPRDLFFGTNGHQTHRAPSARRRIVATYDYTDGAGALLYQVVRYEPKAFAQRRPDGASAWIWNLGDVRRVLYRLPHLAEQDRVYWVEGEKDADGLASRRLAATTGAMGVDAWRPEYIDQLVAQGARALVILPDNDAPGHKYARTIGAAAAAKGLVVRILDLPGLPPKGDVSDWLDAGGTREQLEALVAATAPVTLAELTDAASESAPKPAPASRVRFRAGSDLDATPITYLVEDMLPAGMLGALGGKDGMGKTLFGAEIIKCVLTGQKLFGRFAVQQGTVYALFLDDPEFLVRERLAVMGILDHPDLHVATENDVDMTDPKAMLASLIELLKAAAPRPTFVLVDALYLFIPSGGASDQGNSAGAMAPVIEAFNQVTRETGSALLLVAHDNKAGSDIAGSYAIRAGLKSIIRILLPPAIAKKVAKGDEEARETPERMLQLNKLKTGRPGSWYLRLDGPGQWTFHGTAQAYRKATLPARVIECLWGRGDSTVEEIAKDLKARPFEVRRACVTLHLAGEITKGERPREDGKPGRDATTYGPKAYADVHGTDRSKQGDRKNIGTDRSGERATVEQPDTTVPNLSVPFDPSPRAREAIRPTTPTEWLSVPQPLVEKKLPW
jgi:hypothetical protein